MKVYLCRWANNECSIVCAANKQDALSELDEWASALPEMLTEIKRSFALDFTTKERIDDFGSGIEKKLCWEFNQATEDFFDNVLPEARAVKLSPKREWTP